MAEHKLAIEILEKKISAKEGKHRYYLKMGFNDLAQHFDKEIAALKSAIEKLKT